MVRLPTFMSPRAWAMAVGLVLFAAAALSPAVAHAATRGADTRAVSVTQLQWDLAGLGYMPFAIDGINGPQTTGATRAFQADRCITVDGIDGPQTDGQLSAVIKRVQAAAGDPQQDGLYGPVTKQHVASYQAAHRLTADGQAGPVTMRSMGIQRVVPCGTPPPPPPPPTGHGAWGIDSTTPITSSSLASVRRDAGATPSFWIRYVSDYPTRVSSSEVTRANQNGIRVLLLSADLGSSSDAGSANGTADGRRMVADAKANVNAPRGTLLMKDIENTTDAAFLSAWYRAVENAGYRAGFYLNPLHADIQSDFCGAVQTTPAVKTAIVYSYEPLVDGGPVGPGSAPALSRADTMRCGGIVDVYQYSQGNGGDLFDQDVYNPSTPGTV